MGRALGVAGVCGVEVAPDFQLQGHPQQRHQHRHVSARPRRRSFDGRQRLSLRVCCGSSVFEKNGDTWEEVHTHRSQGKPPPGDDKK